jgi:hypothetical protein
VPAGRDFLSISDQLAGFFDGAGAAVGEEAPVGSAVGPLDCAGEPDWTDVEAAVVGNATGIAAGVLSVLDCRVRTGVAVDDKAFADGRGCLRLRRRGGSGPAESLLLETTQ